MTMSSQLIFLLVQCGTILHGYSMRDRLFTQYLLTTTDFQRINELAPVNPYYLYYSPVASEYTIRRKFAKPPVQNERELKKKLPVKQVTSAESFPSRYLEPPTPNAESDYIKYRNHRMREDEQEPDVLPRNHRPEIIVSKKKPPEKTLDQAPVYIRDHAPIQNSESETVSETKLNGKKKSSKREPSKSLELSPDGDRVEFQIQGHEGPKTYIFGFDTGDGKNRQFRLEEKLKDGTVKGHYGYYDARGKLRTIKYLARPIEGYQEKHHESNNISSEEE